MAWHVHGPGDVPIVEAEHALVTEYRQLLDKLQEDLSGLFQTYADNGILTYTEMAKYNKFRPMVMRLRKDVDSLFEKRALIIKANLKRGYVEAYHDILYQAEKVLSAGMLGPNDILDLETRLNSFEFQEFMEMEAEKELQNGKKPLDTTLKKHNRRTRDTLESVLKRELEGTGTTFREYMSAIKDALDQDGGRLVRVLHTEGNRMINTAVRDAFEMPFGPSNFQLEAEFELRWMHDEPKVARKGHVMMHGQVPDKDGYYTNPLTGNRAKYPGGFGIAEEDIECKCYLKMFRKGQAMPSPDGAKPLDWQDIKTHKEVETALSQYLETPLSSATKGTLRKMPIEDAKQIARAFQEVYAENPGMKKVLSFDFNTKSAGQVTFPQRQYSIGRHSRALISKEDFEAVNSRAVARFRNDSTLIDTLYLQMKGLSPEIVKKYEEIRDIYKTLKAPTNSSMDYSTRILATAYHELEHIRWWWGWNQPAALSPKIEDFWSEALKRFKVSRKDLAKVSHYAAYGYLDEGKIFSEFRVLKDVWEKEGFNLAESFAETGAALRLKSKVPRGLAAAYKWTIEQMEALNVKP